MRNSVILFYFCFLSWPGFAYVAGTSGLSKGDVEVTLKSEFMRGLAGPENLPETQQKQKPSVNIYEVGGGYNWGTLSLFQDLKTRLTGTYFISQQELLNGSLIYPENKGWILGLEVSSNFLHEPDKLFGVFMRVQHPIDMNVAKFVNPKVDRFGLGVQSAFKFSDSFGQETVLFLGSGLSQIGFKQNSSLSASLLGVWILSSAAFRLGPFYDGDLGERNDAGYGTVGVRSFRLGLVTSASVNLNSKFSLEFSYIQKFTGTYFRATKDFILAVRCII